MLALQLALLAANALASPARLAGAEKRQIDAPAADLKTNASASAKAVLHSQDGAEVTVTGLSFPFYDAYLGIPFAEPPTGDLRFKAPVPKALDDVTAINATVPGPACMQPTDAFLASTFSVSEDCLTLQVLTPNGTAGTDAKLPVMVWIYGGGFTAGAASTYISRPLIQYGVETDRPFILVAMNYRLGLFGWGYGADVAKNGAANLGLRDQRLALEWVRDNIEAFGGDPRKVTLAGQSAGAISTSLLMLDEEQDLFRGAIMQSGAQSTLPISNTSVGWNGPYNLTAVNAGCMAPNTTNLGNGTTWECLRRVPATTLNDASIATKANPQYALPFVWGPSIDGDLVPASPYKVLAGGTFSRIPFISGNVRDEGTGSIPQTIDSSVPIELIMTLLGPKPPSPETIQKVVRAYPNVPALGSPYGTGNETFGLDPYFKQLASIIGDVAFQSRRRHFLRQANRCKFTRTWSYDFWGETPGAPAAAGVAHGSDVPFMFGIAIKELNYTEPNVELGRAMMNYWVNFVHYLDPNGDMSCNEHVRIKHDSVKYSKRFQWPTSSVSNASLVGDQGAPVNRTIWLPHQFPKNKNTLILAPGNFTVAQDDFREAQMAAFDGPEMAQELNYRRRTLF